MGIRQMVRHQTLTLASTGSTPVSPVSFYLVEQRRNFYFCLLADTIKSLANRARLFLSCLFVLNNLQRRNIFLIFRPHSRRNGLSRRLCAMKKTLFSAAYYYSCLSP